MGDFQQTENEKYLADIIRTAFGRYPIVPVTHEENGTLTVEWMKPDFTDYNMNIGETFSALREELKQNQPEGGAPLTLNITEQGLTAASTTVDTLRKSHFLETLQQVQKANESAQTLLALWSSTLPAHKSMMQLTVNGVMQTAIRYASTDEAQTVAERLNAAAKETNLPNLKFSQLGDYVTVSPEALAGLTVDQQANLTVALMAPKPKGPVIDQAPAVADAGKKIVSPPTISTAERERIAARKDADLAVNGTPAAVVQEQKPVKTVVEQKREVVASLDPALPAATPEGLGGVPAPVTKKMSRKERREAYKRNRENLAEKLGAHDGADLKALEKELKAQAEADAKLHHKKRSPKFYGLLQKDGELNVWALQADLQAAGYKNVGGADNELGEKTWKATGEALNKALAPTVAQAPKLSV